MVVYKEGNVLMLQRIRGMLMLFRSLVRGLKPF